ALSNVGSLLALITFPFVFEPAFSRQTQAHAWGWGLGLFAVLCGLCAVQVWRIQTPEQGRGATEPTTSASAPAPSLTTRAMWLGLPACASVLLLATTNKICQDVAVVPFLWILPLALYLVSFIVCFDSPAWYGRSVWFRLWILASGALYYGLLAGANLS